MNSTFSLEPDSEAGEQEVVTEEPAADLNTTFTKDDDKKKKGQRKSSVAFKAATPAVGKRKSLLNIPLRKSLAGTPGAILLSSR
jgi:hypothetical protein